MGSKIIVKERRKAFTLGLDSYCLVDQVNHPNQHSSAIEKNQHNTVMGTEGSLGFLGFLGGSDGKESACNAGDPGSILEPGGSPGDGNGNPL